MAMSVKCSGRARQDVVISLFGLLLLALWESSRWDLPLIRVYGTASGFPWREHWLTTLVLHQGARAAGWGLLCWLILSLWKPAPLMRDLPWRERAWWSGTTLICVAVILMLKRASATSCPWSLHQFGGEFAAYVPHWVLGLADGGPGGCFPSGHASTAFAWLPGWFALRLHRPKLAQWFLFFVLASGCALAWAQMMRGAHFLSHSMWTAWICWSIGALSWHSLRTWRDGMRPQVSPQKWSVGVAADIEHGATALDEPEGAIDR